MTRPPHTTETFAIRFFDCVFKGQLSRENLKEIIATANSPNTIGPYSQANKSDRLYFPEKAPAWKSFLILDQKEGRNEPVRVKFLVEGTRREF